MQPGTVILEGVCRQVVLKRLRLKAFRHVYVKALSEHRVWSDEAECEPHEAIDVFLQKEREAMSAMECFLGAATTDTSRALDLPLFREEVVRQHASWLSSKRAHFVFSRHPVMPNPYEGVYAAARPCHGKELGHSLQYAHAVAVGRVRLQRQWSCVPIDEVGLERLWRHES